MNWLHVQTDAHEGQIQIDGRRPLREQLGGGWVAYWGRVNGRPVFGLRWDRVLLLAVVLIVWALLLCGVL